MKIGQTHWCKQVPGLQEEEEEEDSSETLTLQQTTLCLFLKLILLSSPITGERNRVLLQNLVVAQLVK